MTIFSDVVLLIVLFVCGGATMLIGRYGATGLGDIPRIGACHFLLVLCAPQGAF